MKKLMAELIGTFALVFAGTGAIVISKTSGGSHARRCALTFGEWFGVITRGDVGARQPGRDSWVCRRPSFPLGALWLYRQSMRRAFSAKWRIATSLHEPHARHSSASWFNNQSFVLKLILTAILMFTILGVSTGAAEKGITAELSLER